MNCCGKIERTVMFLPVASVLCPPPIKIPGGGEKCEFYVSFPPDKIYPPSKKKIEIDATAWFGFKCILCNTVTTVHCCSN